MSEDRRGVLAGVDGSPESLTAAHWAAAEALRRHSPLELLCAYSIPTTLYAPGFPDNVAGELEATSRRFLTGVQAELHDAHPDLESQCGWRTQMPGRPWWTRRQGPN